MSSQAAVLESHPGSTRASRNRLGLVLSAALVLTAALALALPAASFAATDGDFTYTSDGTSVTITARSASSFSSYLTIPASIGGEPVTAIRNNAFAFDSNLHAISIPASVTRIESSAFYGSGLTRVTFAAGSNLTFIGYAAFTSTSGLTSITIPASVTSIDASAFYYSGLTSVIFLGDVPSVGGNAFAGVPNGAIAYVDPNYTGYGAVGDDFNGLTVASLLTSASTGGEVTITGCAFDPCPLTAITIPDAIGGDPVTTIGDNAFQNNPPAQDTSALTSITIPASITSIGVRAFDGSGLTRVSFAKGSQLATIGERAFQGISGLASITIPASVTTIEEGAFAYSGLTTVSFEVASQLATIGDGAFQFISGLTSITIPDSVTGIGQYAFESASSLARIIFKGNAPTLEGTHVFDTVAAGAKAVLVGGVTGYGADATWNGLEVQRAFQVDTGSSAVVRGSVVKATDLDLLSRPVFAWQRCSTLDDASSCSAISGSGNDGAWWGTRNADIGQQVRLKATMTDGDWLTGLSGVVGPSNSAAPELNQGLVSGAPKKDTKLHTTFGTWGGYIGGSSTVAFQWKRCTTTDASSCTTNVGTNSQWYKPVADDVGSYLRVTATLTTNGQTAVASTAVSSVVASNLVGRRAHTAVVGKKKHRKHQAPKRSRKAHSKG